MKIGAVLPYFGSKRTIAKEIVSELGEHHTYYEPCCGSLAVTMAKPICRSEIVNDLNGDVTCLAWTLAESSTALQLYECVGRTLFSESLHEAALDYLFTHEAPPGPDLEYSYQLLLSSGGDGGRRWASVAESIPDWHERLKRLTILNRDLFEILPNVPDQEGVVIYVDPPYLKKSKRYKHDFQNGDHSRLAHSLRRFERARVVVSYYADPLLAHLYDGWTVRPVKATKFMANASKKTNGATEAPEVLLINGPSLVIPDSRCLASGNAKPLL